MSSASPGRYQSKLFNFVQQQSRRFTEQCEQAFRQVQVATVWGVQVLLYPIYLLFDSTQLEGKLHQGVPQSWHQLQADRTDSQSITPPTVDTPIQRVLQLVEIPSSGNAVANPSLQDTAALNFWEFLSEKLNAFFPKQKGDIARQESRGVDEQETKGAEELLRSREIQELWRELDKNNPNLLSPSQLPNSPSPSVAPSDTRLKQPELASSRKRPMVQGIATQLASRTLVLITAQNEILDILNPQQQQRLQKQIVEEVADYWRHWRLTQKISDGQHSAQLQPPTDQAQLLPSPLFSKLVGWVQTGPEAEGEIHSSSYPSRRAPYILHPSQALALLDRTVADLESNVAPVSEVAIALFHRSSELVQQVQTQFTVYLSGKVQPAGTASQSVNANESESYTLRIQALIWAAIDYFFGDRGGNMDRAMPKNVPPLPNVPSHTQRQQLGGVAAQNSGGAKPRGKRLPHRPTLDLPSRPEFESANVDHWLDESDLFGALENVPSIKEDLGESQGEHLIHYQTSSVSQKTTHSVTRTRKPTGKGAIASTITPSPVSQPPTPENSKKTLPSQHNSKGESQQPHNTSSQIYPAPDWIETKATAMGYVKHPLEQLLEWLDRAMLWLEQVLIILWQLLQRLWRGK